MSRAQRELRFHGVVVGEAGIRSVEGPGRCTGNLQLRVRHKVILRETPKRRDISSWRGVVRPGRRDAITSIPYQSAVWRPER